MTVTDLLERAKALKVMISTAESCTGGMVAAALTDIPGSSAVVERGFVTYTNTAKQEMLGVSAETLADHGAVSEEVAREMADGALTHSQAQLSVSITGIAGPGGSEFKPEGRVCFGLAVQGHPTRTETVEFGALGRDNVRRAARDHALDLISKGLSDID
ncbi:CinA family protein [Roseibium sp. RKSG952]|uniref:CinA family protein n=1 Tax=Roseibium sp. RKSG952 TaxID=2529384 RepID=UPI0013C9A8E2|nr:CinA family protein [Roseibium sp. RKSG952]